jgi:hypothetical protein
VTSADFIRDFSLDEMSYTKICNQRNLLISSGYPKYKTPSPEPETGLMIHPYALPFG